MSLVLCGEKKNLSEGTGLDSHFIEEVEAEKLVELLVLY